MNLRSEFSTAPGEHLHAARDGLSRAERATVIHGPYRQHERIAVEVFWVVLLGFVLVGGLLL